MTADEGAEQTRPALRVVRGGEPTPEELVALVVALSASAVGSALAMTARGSRWADRASMLRKPLDHGPGGWTASTRRFS